MNVFQLPSIKAFITPQNFKMVNGIHNVYYNDNDNTFDKF